MGLDTRIDGQEIREGLLLLEPDESRAIDEGLTVGTGYIRPYRFANIVVTGMAYAIDALRECTDYGVR